MSQLFIIQDNNTLRAQHLSYIFSAYLGIESKFINDSNKKDSEEIFELLVNGPVTGLLLEENSSFADFALKNNLSQKLCLFQINRDESKSSLSSNNHIHFVTSKYRPEEILKKYAHYFKLSPKDYYLKLKSSDIEISIDSLSPGLISPCKMLKKTPEGTNAIAYEGQKISNFLIKALKKEGISKIVIGKKDRLHFIRSMSLQMDTLFEGENKLILVDHGLDFVHSIAHGIGLTKETIQMAKKHIDFMKKNISNHSVLKKSLESMEKQNLSLRFKLIYLTQLISMEIIKKSGNSNPDMINQLTYANYFKDMALRNDFEIQLRSSNELNNSGLDQRRMSYVNEHALFASKILRSFHDIPSMVINIIKAHHGSDSGKGLGLDKQNIPYLSAVIQIAEEAGLYLFNHPNYSSILSKQDFINYLNSNFHSKIYQNIILNLSTIDLEKDKSKAFNFKNLLIEDAA